MGFRNDVEEWRAFAASPPTGSDTSTVARLALLHRLLSNTHLVDAVYSCYAMHRVLKPVVRTKMNNVCRAIAQGNPPPASHDTFRAVDHAQAYFRHLIESLHRHTFDPDLLVRKWATTSRSIKDDPELYDFIADQIAHLDDARVLAIVRGAMDWTVSECCARNQPMRALPFY